MTNQDAVVELTPFYVTSGDLDTCVEAKNEQEAAIKAFLGLKREKGKEKIYLSFVTFVRKHATEEVFEDDMLFDTASIVEQADDGSW